MKNLIPEIAKLLGVEIGEEFKIKVNNSYETHLENLIFMFDEKQGLVVPSENYCSTKTSINVFVRLMRGEYDIVKLPWNPKFDDKYWTFMGSDFAIRVNYWRGNAGDYIRLKCGCVFRTEEEALREKPRIYKELTSNEWSDNNG